MLYLLRVEYRILEGWSLITFGAETDYYLEEKYSWLRPVIVKWLKINRDYIEEHECEDCLYWYTEWASVSSFAGAVWRCGGFALEEYSAKKGKEGYSGRIDLYFSFSDFGVVAEAKADWLNLSSNKVVNFNESISSIINKADEAIECTLEANDPDLGLSLSFIVPYANVGEDVTETMNDLHNAIKGTDCSFYAWFRNTSDVEIKNSHEKVYNAVALIGKITEL